MNKICLATTVLVLGVKSEGIVQHTYEACVIARWRLEVEFEAPKTTVAGGSGAAKYDAARRCAALAWCEIFCREEDAFSLWPIIVDAAVDESNNTTGFIKCFYPGPRGNILAEEGVKLIGMSEDYVLN